MPKPGGDSGSRPAALVVAPEAPYPAIGGGALHTAAIMEYLASRYELDVIVFHEPGARDPRAGFPRGLARDICVIELPCHARSAPARALRTLSRFRRGVAPLNDRFAGFGDRMARWLDGRRYSVGVVEHFWCAPYQALLARHCDRTVLDLHNIESRLYQAYAEEEAWPLAVVCRRFERCCLEMEREWLPKFSVLLTTSEADAERVRAIAPHARVAVYPNTIPLVPVPSPAKEDVIIFSGNLEYRPNLTAVRYFREAIWPVLRERWPGLVWRLIGMNADSVRRYTAGDGRIDLRGPVDDAIEALAQAKVAVVPVLSGSGTRVKILEAWASSTAVVSTRMGAEGLAGRDGEHLLLADSPGDFAAAVSRLLGSTGQRARVASAGRRLYEEEYTWEAGWGKLTGIKI
jgi:glycosyltransferase involved in cell wall biosynthesis